MVSYISFRNFMHRFCCLIEDILRIDYLSKQIKKNRVNIKHSVKILKYNFLYIWNIILKTLKKMFIFAYSGKA